MNKNYDWFDVMISNPDLSVQDFSIAGINDTNTTLKDADYYKDLDVVKEKFIDPETQKFDSKAYEQYYDSVARVYDNYMQSTFNKRAIDKDYSYQELKDMMKLDGSVFLERVPNPTKEKKGIEGVFTTTKGSLSMREAAQNSRVYNYNTGKFLDWTPNDDNKRGLLDFLGIPSLVEARWEEDGWHIDPFTNRKVKHHKGDWKLNEDGNPYYETLGNRDSSGRNFLHYMDTLTVDGSTWNKLDPFDSDGVNKNIGGTIVKTAASIAPLLIPGIREVYGISTAAFLLSQALATFGKAGVEAIDTSYKDNKAWRAFNNYIGYTNRFDSSFSDEGSESLFNLEQASALITDVASQLYQQRTIARIPQLLGLDKGNARAIKAYIDSKGSYYLKKYGKDLNKALQDGDMSALSLLRTGQIGADLVRLEKIQKRAADLSKLYMVATQTEGVYDTFKEYGFDGTSTAIGLLGTAYGFHRLFKTSLGDVALSGLGLDGIKSLVKPITKKMANEAKESFKTLVTDAAEKTTTEAPTKLSKYAIINRVKSYGDKFSNYMKEALENKEIASNMLKESLEEVSEEALQDAVQGSISTINDFLFYNGLKETNDSYQWSSTKPLERYIMSALGGAVGGGIFPLMTKWENFTNGTKEVQQLDKSDVTNWITILRSNPLEAVLEEVDKQEFASKNLSARIAKRGENESYFEPAKNYEDSQDYLIKQQVKNTIRAIDSILHAEIPNLSNDDIIEAAVGREMRFQALMRNTDIVSNIAHDFNTLATNLIQAKSKINSVPDGKTPETKDVEAYNEAKRQMDDFLQGKRSADYTDKLAFLLNPSINAPFYKSNIEIFSMSLGKDYKALSEEEKKKMDVLFNLYKRDSAIDSDKAFEIFKFFRDTISTDLDNYSKDGKYREIMSSIEVYQKQLDDIYHKMIEATIGKDAIELKRAELSEGLSYDEYISKYKLDEHGELHTEEDKKDVVEKDINKKLEQWYKTSFNKAQWANVFSNRQLGFNVKLQVGTLNEIEQFIDNLSEAINANPESGLVISYAMRDSFNNILNMLNFITPDKSIKTTTGSLTTVLESFVEQLMLSTEEKYTTHLKEGSNLIKYINDALGKDYKLSKGGIDIDKDVITVNVNDGNNENIIYIDKQGNIYSPVIDEDGEAYFDEKESELLKEAKDISWDITRVVSLDVRENLKDVETTPIIGGFLNRNLEVKSPLNEGSVSVSDRFGKHLEEVIKTSVEGFSTFKKAIDLSNKLSKQSPIEAMLSKISKAYVGEDIFDVLKKESDAFSLTEKLTEFTINDEIARNQLDTMLQVISIAKAIITSSISPENYVYDPLLDPTSFVDMVNATRKTLGIQSLPSISDHDSRIMLGELNDLEANIKLMLQISDNNKISLLQESTKSAINNEFNLIALLTKTDAHLSLFGGNIITIHTENGDEDFFDFEFDFQKFQELKKSGAKDEDLFEFIDEQFSKMTDYYYKRFNSLDEVAQNEILSIIAQQRDKDGRGIDYIGDNFTTRLDSKTEIKNIHSEFIANYIVAMLTADQNEIKRDFLKVLEDSNMNFAPFFNQYISIAMALSNNEKINYFLEEKQKSIVNITNSSSDLYPVSKNTTVILGDPGCGKTSAIAYFINEIKKLRNSREKIIAAAVTDERATNLSRTLEGSKKFTIKELFDHFLTDSGKQKVSEYLTKVKSGTSVDKLVLSDKDIIKIDDPITIIIDEYTNVFSEELRLLQQIPKTSFILLGDDKQIGASIVSAGKRVFKDLRGLFYSAPVLGVSVRCQNAYKHDNQNILSLLLNRLNDEIAIKSVAGSTVDITQIVDKLRDLPFRYYESEGTLQGEKIVESISENDIKVLLDNLEEGEKLAYIYTPDKQDTEIYNIIQQLKKSSEYNNKIEIRGSNNVQGSEFKYTIVDVTYSNKDNPNDFTNKLKEFYTFVTRSKNGSILISGKDNSNNLPVIKNKKLDFPNESKLSESDISEYKRLITNIYNKSLESVGKTPKPSKKSSNSVPPNNITEVRKKREEQAKNIDNKTKSIENARKAIENTITNSSDETEVYSSISISGLQYNNGEFETIDDDNTDLNVILPKGKYSPEAIFATDAYKDWSLLKLYLITRKYDEDLTGFKSYTDKLGIALNDFLGILKDKAKTKFRIKIEPNNQSNNTQLRSTDYKYSDTNNNYARLIASIEYEPGNFIEVSVANVKQDLDIFKNKINEKITNSIYIDLDDETNANLVENGFKSIGFTSFKVDSTNDKNANEYGISVSDYLKIHPEIKASNIVYYNQEVGGGEAYIFIDDNNSGSTKDLRADYLNNEHTTVRKIRVDVSNMSIDEFIANFKNLEGKAHSTNIDDFFRFKYLVPQTLGGRILSALFEYRDKLINAKKNNPPVLKEGNSDDKEFNSKSEKVNGLIRKSIKPEITNINEEIDNVNKVIRDVLDKLQSIKDLSINYSNKNITRATIENALASGDILGINAKDYSVDYGKDNSGEFADIPKFTEKEINYIYSRNKSSPGTRTLKEILEDIKKSTEGIKGVEKSDDFRKKAELALKLMNNINVNLLSHNIEQVLSFLSSSHIAVFNKNLAVARVLLNDANSEISKRAMQYSGAFSRGVWTTGKKVTDYDEYGIPANVGLDKVYFPFSVTERKVILPLKFKEEQQNVNTQQEPEVKEDPIETLLKDKELEGISKDQKDYVRETLKDNKPKTFVLINNEIKLITKDKNIIKLTENNTDKSLISIFNTSNNIALWNNGSIYIKVGDTITKVSYTKRNGFGFSTPRSIPQEVKDFFNLSASSNTSENNDDSNISEYAQGLGEYLKDPSSNIITSEYHITVNGTSVDISQIKREEKAIKEHLIKNLKNINNKDELVNVFFELFKLKFENGDKGNGNLILKFEFNYNVENQKKIQNIKRVIFEVLTIDEFKNIVDSNINSCNTQ